jgi:hypothetical protein
MNSSSSRSGRGRRMMNKILIDADGKTRLRDRGKGSERGLSTGEIVTCALECQAAK